MKMSVEERNALIKENPHYGQIICNCEKVSLGEIEDELSRSLPPHTIKALKKRTRAGFGKCQGGFCQPNVLLLLAKHFGIDEIHFAMVVIFNFALGALSPPMGTLMFVTCSITKCPMGTFIKEAVPFYTLLIICLLLLTFVPAFSTGLVNLIY